MHSRSAATKAAQAAEKSASSQDEKKITFNIGSNKNGRKKPSGLQTNSDTDYPCSGSSAATSKASSQSFKSSLDATLACETEELPSNVSLSLPSSGSSLTYNAMKNSLAQESFNEPEQLGLESPDGTGRITKTSTPQKRRAQKSDSDPKRTLEHIAEETAASLESNSEDNIIQSSQPDTVRIVSPETGAKRKRQVSGLSDSELPDTLAALQHEVASKKLRQSVEIIGVRNKNACPTPVVDLADESDDESNRLYLSQSQSQGTHTASHLESFARLSQHITPIVLNVEDEVNDPKTNGKSSLNLSDMLPLNASRPGLKDYLPLDDAECYEVPSSLRTFARVKDNLNVGFRTAMASPRLLGRLGAPRSVATPPSAEVVDLDSEHVTPETNGSAEETTFHSVVVLVNYSLSVNQVTRSCRREVVDFCVQGEGVSKVVAAEDVSPGVLADVSGHSKPASPGSVTSTGLFPLATVRQSMVSTVSSSSATSAASLQEKMALKACAGPNSLRPPNAFNKFNSVGKNAGRDLRVDVCIPEKHLIHLESMSSRFDSPSAAKSPVTKPQPKTNGEPHSPAKISSSTPILSEPPYDKIIPPALNENVPFMEAASQVAVNGSADLPDPSVASPIPAEPLPSSSKSRKKTKSSKKPAARATAQTPVTEPCVETPKSSTKKRGARSRSTRKPASGSRKPKMTPIAEAVPVKEATSKERKARVPPARKGLVLSSPYVEKPLRRGVDEVTSDDLLDPLITPEQPMLAFARWNDKRYYSCTVIGRTKDGKFNIKFDDGKSKCLTEEFVIPVVQLRKGLSVFAQVDDEDYEPGTIFELKLKDGVVTYVVELDSGKSVSIPRSALFLTEDQATVLQEETWGYSSPSCPNRRAADVSLDNMVGGTRRRFASVVRRLPIFSGGSRPTPTPTSHSDTSDDVNYANEDIYGVDIEFYPLPYPSLKDGGLSKAAGKVKGRGKDVATEKTTDLQLNELLGPIPENGSKLFAGMQFLFTSVSATVNALGQMQEETCESSTSDGESICKIPLIKERLVAQLEAGGGVVYERFELLKGYTDAYLIASASCQTAKYLLCLAHKVPIISHDWVISCVKTMKKQPLSRYLLTAGRDVVHGNFVDQKTRQGRDLILRNVDVLIVSEVDYFIGFWTKVLEAMGARVSSLAPDSDERPKETDVYVVLSDNSIVGSKMRTWACSFNVRIVNPDWVKYCLIKGAKGDINLEQFSLEIY